MGCGKSTLMQYVTGHESTKEHLLEWANGQKLLCSSYYFSKRGTSELQRSLQGLYRTLLATLILHEQSLSSVAFPDWQNSDSEHEPTPEVLRDALRRVLKSSRFSCKYCLFIDGLDEYQETDNELRGELAKDILGLARLSAVKLVVSSRPETVFRLSFAGCPTMKLHDLTRRDIAAYVDAEVRRKALPQVLASTETDQLNALCDEAVRKARGVFLWVTIAVASILSGIADYETFSELESRLSQLDPKLSILFKQVLTERVQASHRQQVARCLLAEHRFDTNFLSWLQLGVGPIVQAISPHVDASHNYTLLLDDRKIDDHVSEMYRCLPGRSCGLYSIPRYYKGEPIALALSHSSLHEFLDEHETQALLLEQAGDDFQVDEAIAVGRMAHFVYRIERGRYGGKDSIRKYLFEIVHSIEMSEISTGLTQTKLTSTFDELLSREYKNTRSALVLAGSLQTNWDPMREDHTMWSSHMDELSDWSCLRDSLGKKNSQSLHIPSGTGSQELQTFPQGSETSSQGSETSSQGGSRHLDVLDSNVFLQQPQSVSHHGSDLLSITISCGMSSYLKYKMSTCRGVPQKTGTPLLFYPLWTMEKFLDWVEDERMMRRRLREQCHATPVKLLLAAGADPNEVCRYLTPWSILLQRMCSGRDDDFPLKRKPPEDVTWPEESFSRFRSKLEVAKLMLQYDADPFFRVETPRFIISTQIFAELLERQCCSGNSLNDCECSHARKIQPQLTELVKLVEERKYMKEQMRTDGELLVRGVWLVVVLAYILQSFLISSF
jgi:hypothetical protein